MLKLRHSYEERGEAFLSRIITGDVTKVFHYTLESKAESVTCKHPHSPVTNKFESVYSPGKVMDTDFWDVHRVLLIDFTPSGSTINVSAYQETVKRLKEATWHNRPGLLTKEVLLHDSARPHSAATTMNLLKSWGCEILPHPQHSRGLALSDFHLLSKMKKNLRDQRIHSSEDVQNEVKKRLHDQDSFFFCEGLDELLYHCDECLNMLGDSGEVKLM
jgi:hypothetical protein